MWSLVVLTGFSYEEMYGRFAGTKKSGRNNEVVVRRGSTVVHVLATTGNTSSVAGYARV